MQELVGGAPVSELAFNSELRYLIVRLASGSRKELEGLAPDMGKLKALAPPSDQVFGYVVTAATGAILCKLKHCLCNHLIVPGKKDGTRWPCI